MARTPKAAKPTGRPSTYTPELAERIMTRLADGEFLAAICRDDDMPGDSTVYDWIARDQDLAKAMDRARERGAHAIAQRARMTLRGKGPDDGGESTGDVQRDKAIADFDLKVLGKWHPKLYGDRVTVAGDPDAPLRTVKRIERIIVDPAASDT